MRHPFLPTTSALDRIKQHNVHWRVSLYNDQLAGYKFQMGALPAEDPPLGCVFGDMEATLDSSLS